MFKRKIIKPLRRRVFVNNNSTWGKGYQVMALSFFWLIHTITSLNEAL
ncbi:Uncharacterised protein [Shewanella putrefaciens]|nr:Uncharacterised protein [Shewanella putrefaciens]